MVPVQCTLGQIKKKGDLIIYSPNLVFKTSKLGGLESRNPFITFIHF